MWYCYIKIALNKLFVFENIFRNETITELFEIAKLYGDFVEDEYCVNIVNTVENNKSSIDEIISRYAKGWKLERLSKVSLAALRIAIAEIEYLDEIPTSVSVNEAVELVKKYATVDDSSFVNGILGSFIRNEKVDK